MGKQQDISTGENSAHFGDGLELMKLIPDKSIPLIFADLPYGTTKCRWDTPIDLIKMWQQYERIMTPNAAVLLFAQSPFDKVLGASNLPLLKYEWIWEKTQATGHLNAKKMPMKAHENILVFYKNLPTYNPQMTYGHKRKTATAHHKRNCKTGDIYGKCDNFSDYDSTDRFPRSVLKFKSDKQKQNLHSTQKPLSLVEYFIKTYSNEGDVVLDNTAGSFTLAIGCLNNNRKYIVMENDENIFNDGMKRIEDWHKSKVL
jgi:DNA modification methylase